MPNYCENSLRLSHSDPEMISRAVKAFCAESLLNEFLPCPPELLQGDGWYGWRKYNWGTKWDVGNKDAELLYKPGDTDISLSFDSAWTPPTAWYSHMESLGFTVEAYWWEPGMNFCGEFANGEVSNYDIQGDADWVDANIPQNINEAMAIAENMSTWEQIND